MLNVKNHLVYSDKFQLSVVNLKQIKLATEEDKAYKIDYWAAVFKAKTWEEMRMLVKENEYLEEQAQKIARMMELLAEKGLDELLENYK